MWFDIVIISKDVLIPEEVNIIGLIIKLCVFVSNFTFTDVDVPIPTEMLGLTWSDTESLIFKLCEVETETTVFTLVISARVCL